MRSLNDDIAVANAATAEIDRLMSLLPKGNGAPWVAPEPWEHIAERIELKRAEKRADDLKECG